MSVKMTLFIRFFLSYQMDPANGKEAIRECENDIEEGADTEKYAEYFNYMLGQGIYLAPSQFEAMFVSYAHTKADLERTCQAIMTCQI